MSVTTILGTNADGDPLPLDLDRLIGGHAAIVANSGGGKSGLVRRLLEVTHGRVQHVVLDIEDEFYTLRERFPYVIAGGDGADAPATVDGAAALARATLEHGFSLIAQLNDLGEDAPAFVGAFLTGLISAPRDLWRPLLVVIDEVHRFAPQDGRTDASAGVKALTGQGRKRGFTAILASQRIAKIDTDVRGDVNNWLLGRVGQALDRKTMADALGFRPTEAMVRFRAIEPRQFFAFGPAIAAEPTLFRVGDVETTPVRPGQAKVATPPAPEALREILAGLSPSAEPVAGPGGLSDPTIPTDPLEALRVGRAAGEMILERDRRIADLEERLASAVAVGQRAHHAVLEIAKVALAKVEDLSAELRDNLHLPAADLHPDDADLHAGIPGSPAETSPVSLGGGVAGDGGQPPASPATDVVAPLNSSAIAMAEILKATPDRAWTWAELALLTIRRPGSGDQGKARAAIVQRGWVLPEEGGRVRATAELDFAQEIADVQLPTPPALIQAWADRLRGPGGDILRALAGDGGRSTKAEIGRTIGKSPTSGWFGTGMKDLVRSNLVLVDAGTVRLAPLLDEGAS